MEYLVRFTSDAYVWIRGEGVKAFKLGDEVTLSAAEARFVVNSKLGEVI